MSDDWRNDPRFKSSAEDEKQYQKDKKKDAKYTKIGLIVLSIPIIGFFGLGLLGVLWNNFYDLGSFAKLVPGLIIILVLIFIIPMTLAEPLNNYANFNGTTSRKEFWLFYLYVFIYVLVLQFADWFSGMTAMIFYGGQYVEFAESFIAVTLFQLFILVPSLSIGARRLHEIGKSGWWQLLTLTGVGIILLIIWWSQEGNVKLIKNKISKFSDIDVDSKLRELNKLYKDGIITKKEFTDAKKKYL